jgi:hypothetical protein
MRYGRAWDFESLKPTPAYNGFWPELSDPAGTLKPTPAERGFSASVGYGRISEFRPDLVRSS